MTIAPFTRQQAEQLRHFLAAPERPANTFSYGELAGFLFALCCAPEMVPPSAWLPLVLDDTDNAHQDPAEAQKILALIMELYNHINQGVLDKQPALPPQCEARREIPSNLETDAPFSQWARGFGMGHEYLSALWDAHAPTKVSEDLGSCLMVLTFFASRELAEEYQREFRALDRPLESFAEQMIDLFPEALTQYMLLGISIAAVLRQRPTAAPAGSVKIDRNDPCPCGSGKKYKDCCGAAVH